MRTHCSFFPNARGKGNSSCNVVSRIRGSLGLIFWGFIYDMQEKIDVAPIEKKMTGNHLR